MAIDTEEKRASTCAFLQPWVLPGMRAGSTGTAWRQAAAHTYAEPSDVTPAERLQGGNLFAKRLLGLRNVQGL